MQRKGQRTQHCFTARFSRSSQVNKPPLTCRKHGQSNRSPAVTLSQICSLGTEFLLPKQVICLTRPVALWGDFPWDCGNPRCQSPQGVSQCLPSWPGKSSLSTPCSHWTCPYLRVSAKVIYNSEKLENTLLSTQGDKWMIPRIHNKEHAVIKYNYVDYYLLIDIGKCPWHEWESKWRNNLCSITLFDSVYGKSWSWLHWEIYNMNTHQCPLSVVADVRWCSALFLVLFCVV